MTAALLLFSGGLMTAPIGFCGPNKGIFSLIPCARSSHRPITQHYAEIQRHLTLSGVSHLGLTNFQDFCTCRPGKK